MFILPPYIQTEPTCIVRPDDPSMHVPVQCSCFTCSPPSHTISTMMARFGRTSCLSVVGGIHLIDRVEHNIDIIDIHYPYEGGHLKHDAAQYS